MEPILKSYQRRLINLSASNRTLVLRRLAAGLHLDFQDLDFILAKPAFGLLSEIIAGKTGVPLAPLADPRQAGVAPVSRKLKEISRRAAFLKEERGSPELYVGWPFVSGKLNDGTILRCPLLFFPVNLELNGKQQWELQQLKTATPFFNQSFLLAYAHYNQVRPDEELLNFDFADFPNDALEFRTKLYELLKNSSLEINFNQELFQDKLLPFRSFTKPELEKQFRSGELKLFPEAVLGIFPQAGSYLMADYDALLQQPEPLSFETIFKSEPDFGSTAGKLEQNTFAVFDLDAPQEQVLQEVKQGRSVVVQGPPGTGKSQLICNLVTDFVARGKTVWVVCQKRAALDVVYKRLAQKGFGNFAALVHDFEADRRRIFDQLKFQIEEVETYKKHNNQLQIVYAERQFLEASRRINQILETLTNFKTALFNASVCGWPAKELYLRSSLKIAAPDLPEFRNFTAETLPFFLPKLEAFLKDAARFDAPDFALNERLNFANWSWPEHKKLEQLVTEIPEKMGAFREALPEEIQQKFTAFQAWKLLQSEIEHLSQLQELAQGPEVVFAAFSVLFSLQAKEFEKALKLLKQLEQNYATESVWLSENELQSAKAALQSYENSRENWWAQTKWKFGAKKEFTGHLNAFNLSFSEPGIAAFKTRLNLLQARQTFKNNLAGIFGESLPVFSANEAERKQQFLEIKSAVHFAQLAGKLKRQKLVSGDPETVGFEAEKLLELLQDLDFDLQTWHNYLPEDQVEKLASDATFRQQFLQALNQHFEEIAAHDSRFSDFSETEKTVAKRLQKLPGTVAEKLGAFENAVYLNWLLHLESVNPELKLAGPEINKLEAELQALILKKQQLSHEIVLTRLREKTYSNLEKNRLGNVVSYRKLFAQVSKKRNLFSLRKLQANFGQEIADLVPCWLASPETISAVFPISQQPDLVIFDEASQAFAETGLPAIFRARQVVIAGDEYQLAPADLYRSRWQEAEEEAEELAVESLLQLGSLHLPQFWLTEHYRSRFPELIQFSNQHFYRHKLQLIPEKQDLENSAPAIKFVKVNGLWENQTNRLEAEKVTEILFRLLAAGYADIGIITFNYTQQTLIQDLAEAQSRERNVALPQSVQIKNIENMQGDEKQIVIFSIGYAPDAAGKIPAQFGSLSQAKGENRLNVAITRAISEIYVVSSLYAEDLQVENARHAGPKLLQEYLRYARRVSEGKFEWLTSETQIHYHPFFLKEKLNLQAKTVGKLSKKLPFTDLVLQRENQYCHLFRTDDDLYYGQLSARHSHFDVPFRLQKRNWPYTAFYSRQFWLQPEKLVQQIQETPC